MVVNTNKQQNILTLKGLALGFWKSSGTEKKRDSYVILSFMKTGIWYFGHIKRNVSFPTFFSPLHLKFLWDMKTLSSSLPHAENYFGFFAFSVSENTKKKVIIQNLHCMIQFKLFMTGSLIKSIYFC